MLPSSLHLTACVCIPRTPTALLFSLPSVPQSHGHFSNAETGSPARVPEKHDKQVSRLPSSHTTYEGFHDHQQQNSLWQPGILFHRRRWFSSPNAAGRREPLQRAIATDSAYPPASPQLCCVPIASWPVGSFLAGSTVRGTPDFPLATNLSERVCRIACRARPERRPRRG